MVRKKTARTFSSFVLFLVLTAAVLVSSFSIPGVKTTLDNFAAETKRPYDNRGNLFTEQFDIKVNTSTPVKPVTKNSEKVSALPVTGTWQGKKIKVVPNDRFFLDTNHFTSYGVRSFQGLRDGRVIGGGYAAIFVKNPQDTEWTNLELYTVPTSFNLSANVTIRIVETNQAESDIYLMGNQGLLRFNPDHSFTELVENDNHIGDIHDIVPYGNNGVVFTKNGPIGYGSGALYYTEGDVIRKWLLPKPHPQLNSDSVSSLFLDPSDSSNRTFYAIITCQAYGGLCPAEEDHRFYLFQFRFSSDLSVPLEAIRLAKLYTSGETNGTKRLQLALRNRNDDPSKKILFGSSGNWTQSQYGFYIPEFNSNFAEMTINYYPLPDYQQGGMYRNLVIEKNQGKNTLWYSGSSNTIYKGTNIGENNSQIIYMNNQERQILANPYTASLTQDITGNLLVGHEYLGDQFNKAMVTILEPEESLPTLSVINGGFENGTSSWTLRNMITNQDKVVQNGGHKAFRITALTNRKAKTLRQTFYQGTLPQGFSFTVSLSNRLNAEIRKKQIQVKVLATTENGVVPYPLFLPEKSHSWKTYQKSFTLTSAASALSLLVKYRGTTSATFIDDLTVTSPATVNDFGQPETPEADDL